jgi:hypothetical protein
MRCADLESCGAPIDELNGTLGLDGGNGGLYILRHDITTVQQAASHVFSFTGIGFDHLVSGLEAGEGHLSHRVLLVVGFVLKRRQYQWLKEKTWNPRQRGEENRWREGNECGGMAQDWSGTRSNRHLGIRRIAEKR